VRRRLGQLAAAVVGLGVAWLGFLLLFGWLGADCVRGRAEARLAGSMQADVSIGALDLALVRGAVRIDRIVLERRDRGYLRIAIDRVDADLWPVGLALAQDSLGTVRIRGVDAEVSALGVLDMRGRTRAPVTFDRLEVEDATVRLEAARALPGLARIEVVIERAVAGPTTLRTPMSWLLSLRELTARIELPLAPPVRVDYADGVLRVSGGPFGGKMIELPFEIPPADPAREVDQLAALGRRLAAQLTEAYVEAQRSGR
jgi:hypothetical protein